MSMFHRFIFGVIGLACFVLSGVCVLGVGASFLADSNWGIIGSTAGFMLAGVTGSGFFIFAALGDR